MNKSAGRCDEAQYDRLRCIELIDLNDSRFHITDESLQDNYFRCRSLLGISSLQALLVSKRNLPLLDRG